MAISCDPDDLQQASATWVLSEARLNAIDIYALVTWANGGIAPQVGFTFGDPDVGWSFGDPGTGDELGAPI